MKFKNYSLLLLYSLTACAGTEWQPSEVEEVFVTDIKASGLKIFDYSLTNNTPQASAKRSAGGKQGDGKGMGGGKSGGYGRMGGGNYDNHSSMKPYFNNMLEAKLKKSGYCRQGYYQLDSYFGRGQLKMRGECVEGATDEDRINFANKENS